MRHSRRSYVSVWLGLALQSPCPCVAAQGAEAQSAEGRRGGRGGVRRPGARGGLRQDTDGGRQGAAPAPAG